ncbi:hypothetical protein [Vibrio owensii]|uniref:Uncharacterized protein n=1 Tax=Vibrio owensii CAIM 1854 = LMG 25443 TaxID=1229493 RepID=A0A0C1VQS7_9VIBR|nr:hypothetical protein [Vibrio owensii]KIF52248.1 hypothetical protein H735_15670 [Vibrio owensii CAIM 1854 = LMG 25443]
MDWIMQNKEWLFSGVAIAVPIAVLSYFFSNRNNKQIQKGGNNSTNIQIGKNLNLRGKHDDK